MVKILKTHFIFVLPEPHRVHYLFHIKIHPTDVKPKLVHHHLELIFKLTTVGFVQEVTLENRVRKYLIPRNTILLFKLQTSPYEVYRLRRKIIPTNNKFFRLYVSHELNFCRGSPRRIPVKDLVENEPKSPNITFGSVFFTF